MSFDFDLDLIKRVSMGCGSEALKGASGYLSFIRYHSAEKFWGFSVDETAFLYGTFARKHFRLMEIAVEKESQGRGYGNFMLSVLFEECIKRGIYIVTLRTSQREEAYKWYQRLGAKIVGVKDRDYEMRFEI